MDIWKALQDGGSFFMFFYLVLLILYLIDKHNKKEEFDYKGFSKFTFYAFALSIATFFASLFHLGDFAQK